MGLAEPRRHDGHTSHSAGARPDSIAGARPDSIAGAQPDSVAGAGSTIATRQLGQQR